MCVLGWQVIKAKNSLWNEGDELLVVQSFQVYKKQKSSSLISMRRLLLFILP